jgi:ribosomal protein S6--L-glutamate ligase
MHIIVLAKERHAAEPMFQRFIEHGAARGHAVQLRDKKAFRAGDLRQVDVVCLKSHIDDEQVWRMIEAQGVRAVNACAACLACSERSRLDAILHNGGARTPRSASRAAEVERLRYPIIQKSNSLAAPRDIRVLHRPPREIDCERYFYQEMILGDGAVYKVYCIGAQAFLVKEADTDADGDTDTAVVLADGQGARRQAAPIPVPLAEAALNVGRLTGLEVYGVDFVGSADAMFVIDVNPFPSFRALPQAADALWDYLEK